MSRGEAWDRIRLVDAGGKPLDLPFLELDQELWDPEQRRLTVLFDPGRIKRGVKPRDESGTALERGKEYALVIDSAWHDANGQPLESGHIKQFSVVAEDRVPLDLATWTIDKPGAGTREPLRVRLPEPADHALLERMISVELDGRRLIGKATGEQEDRVWSFVSDVPWTPGEYSLAVNTALEDLAGNRVGRAFDVDVFDRVTKRVEEKIERLSFRISGK